MVRWPAGSLITLVWGVSIRILPLPDRHIRDADCVGGVPPAACVLVVQSEHEGGVDGIEAFSTVRQSITNAFPNDEEALLYGVGTLPEKCRTEPRETMCKRSQFVVASVSL